MSYQLCVITISPKVNNVYLRFLFWVTQMHVLIAEKDERSQLW